MTVATMAVRFRVEEDRITPILQEAAQSLEKTDADLILDFSCVRRLDANAIGALEKLAQSAERRKVKAILRGVNIGVYKVLKLVSLTTKFSFLAPMQEGPES